MTCIDLARRAHGGSILGWSQEGGDQMEQESKQAVEVARVACGFPRTPEGRDRLLRQVKAMTAKLDPAAVMIALGALLRRGIDRALDEGREDETSFKESERFFERWLSWEERRADRL